MAGFATGPALVALVQAGQYGQGALVMFVGGNDRGHC